MTKFVKNSEIKCDWYEIDAKNAVVGRLATIISKIIRGKNKIPVQGGPDTMRAIYGETQKDSTLKAVAGDGLIAYVEWDINGDLSTESIHQYGSATQDEESMHYSDQMNLFSEERLKMTFFKLDQLKINTSSQSEIPLNVQ